jgi:outer membrane protein assembly factor BamD (BamD/ComL family)
LFEEEMNFMYAHNQELVNNKVEAVKEYKKFMEKYPSSRHTAEAKESLARLS